MYARLHADGSLTDIGTGARGAALWPDAERVEIDAMPPGFGPFILDPENPRRAIVAPPPAPTYAELRAREYPPTDALVVALWERFIEGRPEASEALEAKRQAVKAKHPEPKE